MKVTIKKRFRDIETRQIMHVGQVAEYDTGRAVELSVGGFVTLEDTIPEEDELPGSDDDNQDQGAEGDSEKPDADVTPEKVETSHVPKAETKSNTGKRGGKSSK